MNQQYVFQERADRRLVHASGRTAEEACAAAVEALLERGLCVSAVVGRCLFEPLAAELHDVPFVERWDDALVGAVLEEQARMGCAQHTALVVDAELLTGDHAVSGARAADIYHRPDLNVWIVAVTVMPEAEDGAFDSSDSDSDADWDLSRCAVC